MGNNSPGKLRRILDARHGQRTFRLGTSCSRGNNIGLKKGAKKKGFIWGEYWGTTVSGLKAVIREREREPLPLHTKCQHRHRPTQKIWADTHVGWKTDIRREPRHTHKMATDKTLLNKRYITNTLNGQQLTVCNWVIPALSPHCLRTVSHCTSCWVFRSEGRQEARRNGNEHSRQSLRCFYVRVASG